MVHKDSNENKESVNDDIKTVSQKKFSGILGVSTALIRQLDKENALDSSVRN